ncbi:MAG TPA: bifunctional demethylmenaquinone methyltransferase/2-methoxy-6-polyprenyl-1,4-benzoquinol methylase UbiE [Chitinophagaceae bacterium]|nr:MAG: ubiquinone/menaquinone biosynthesis methyltransferase [Bacteroidetes bacterium OLB11]HMN31873.1 bifunctional demethylmenaquinone methyltransferase/2-methoxy-6-polyprenyl-1,4-benzoquinol methylase UbiE [Chitinophagaceae bacterium]
MQQQVVPDATSSKSKKEQVENMFDGIAPKYDFINRILSLRIDLIWRKKVIKILKPFAPKQILDVATGTGDLAIALCKLNPEQVIGIDISAGMLEVGKVKIAQQNLDSKIHFQKADCENLPYQESIFDAVTVAFGVRNFENLEKGLQEIFRVLKPEAHLVILEFSKVKRTPIKQFYNFYFRYITPVIGKIFSKNANAYTYLPNSVQVFPEGEEMCVILQNIGFKKVVCQSLSLGIASIYHCQK